MEECAEVTKPFDLQMMLDKLHRCPKLAPPRRLRLIAGD